MAPPGSLTSGQVAPKEARTRLCLAAFPPDQLPAWGGLVEVVSLSLAQGGFEMAAVRLRGHHLRFNFPSAILRTAGFFVGLALRVVADGCRQVL